MNCLKIGNRNMFDAVAIQLSHMNPQNIMKLHKHEFHELVIIHKGRGIHVTEDDEYPIMAGDVFLIKPDAAHGYDATEDLCLTNIFYVPQELKLPLGELNELPGYHAFFELEPTLRHYHGFKSRLQLTLEQLKEVESYIYKLEHTLSRKDVGYRFKTFAMFVDLLFYLSKCYQNVDSKHTNMILRLGEIISYMDHNFKQPIGLEKLVRLAGMSKRSLIRHFKEAMNMTPIEYLIKVRITEASQLMSSDLSLSEIAMETGFSDSNYFSRQFKKVTGLSPRYYRRQKMS